MRRLAVFAALLGMIAAPMAPAGAAATETADIYNNGDVHGPSFARATQCTAVFSVSLNAVAEGSEDYDSLFKVAIAWLRWSKRIADGRDAEAEIKAKSATLNQRFAKLSPEGSTAELSKEITACQTIKTMMNGMEPFTTVYTEAVTGRPAFTTAVDCATTYSVIAQSVGKDDANYDWFNDGVEMWSQYAVDQGSGSDKQKIDAVTARATQKGAVYTKLLTDDQEAGIAKLIEDRDSCKALEPGLPKYFKNR